MIEINLLPQEKGLSQQEKQIRLILSLSALVLGVIVGLVFAAATITDAILTSQYNGVIRKKETLLAQYQSQGEIVRELQTVKDKVAVISIVQNVQGDFSQIVDSLRALFGEQIKINELQISSDGRIDASLVFSDLAKYGEFMDRINQKPTEFHNIKVDSLAQKDDGTIALVFSMNYRRKA